MGMKSAACWFSPAWHVRTSALGEATEKLVTFDIAKIIRDELEELEVQTRSVARDTHFTEIVLTKLHRMPVGRTIGKIKEHLAEIYRVFIREKLLVLQFNGETLSYVEPDVLVAPLHDSNNEPVGKRLEWRKEITFDFGTGLTAHGFAGLRKEGSTTHAGFSLFRRKRLIVGSVDEKYRPGFIFGAPNDFVYQRLFGELHLTGFDVTHTKDGFQWDENEEPFLELLKEHLDALPLPLLKQARNYRTRPTRAHLRQAARDASESTSKSIERNAPPVLAAISATSVEHTTPTSLPEAELASQRVIDIEFQGASGGSSWSCLTIRVWATGSRSARPFSMTTGPPNPGGSNESFSACGFHLRIPSWSDLRARIARRSSRCCGWRPRWGWPRSSPAREECASPVPLDRT